MAWVPITNAEIDPDSPATTGLMTKYRGNDEALRDSFVLVRKPALENEAGVVLQDDDDLKLTMPANTTWYVRLGLNVRTDLIATDFQFDFTFPVGATYLFLYDAHGSNVLATIVSDIITEASGATLVNYAAAGAANHPLWIDGIVVNAANAGDLQLQWACAVAGVSTMRAGSFLVASQDPTTI